MIKSHREGEIKQTSEVDGVKELGGIEYGESKECVDHTYGKEERENGNWQQVQGGKFQDVSETWGGGSSRVSIRVSLAVTPRIGMYGA